VLDELKERSQPGQSDDLLRLGLHQLPVKRFPRLRALAGEPTGSLQTTRVDEGLDVVAGLHRQRPEVVAGRC
jgi:hypothetical protein